MPWLRLSSDFLSTHLPLRPNFYQIFLVFGLDSQALSSLRGSESLDSLKAQMAMPEAAQQRSTCLALIPGSGKKKSVLYFMQVETWVRKPALPKICRCGAWLEKDVFS